MCDDFLPPGPDLLVLDLEADEVARSVLEMRPPEVSLETVVVRLDVEPARFRT